MSGPLYRWLAETKPRRVFTACVVTLLLLFMHTINAAYNALRAALREYRVMFLNIRLMWVEYVPKGYVDDFYPEE
jgi:hypothetical protein